MPFDGRLCQILHKPFCELYEKLMMRGGKSLRGTVSTVHKQEIDIGTVVEFLPSEFSQTDNREGFIRDDAILLVHLPDRHRQHSVYDDVSQDRELGCGCAKISKAENVLHSHAQYLTPQKAAQRVEPAFCPGKYLRQPLHLGTEVVLFQRQGKHSGSCQPAEQPRIPHQDVCEKRGIAKYPDQHIQQHRVLEQIIEQPRPAERGFGEPEKSRKGKIGIRSDLEMCSKRFREVSR